MITPLDLEKKHAAKTACLSQPHLFSSDQAVQVRAIPGPRFAIFYQWDNNRRTQRKSANWDFTTLLILSFVIALKKVLNDFLGDRH